MDAPTVAAIAASVSAAIAAAALGVAAMALARQSKSIDLANCLEILNRIGDAQRRLNCATREKSQFEFIEIANLLETLAMLYRQRRYGKTTKHSVQKFLIEAIAWMEITPAANALCNAVTGETTFKNLQAFRKRFGKKVDAQRDALLRVRARQVQGANAS